MCKVKIANAIRVLSADMVQEANSGHPGFPLGAAGIITALYSEGMAHSPKNPSWFNRDRFVLSAGHGSAMLYSTLHLFGYPKMTISELKRFRQLDSITPGHPEYGATPGVEATTGPLGAGMGMAVGLAMAEAHLAAKFNKDDAKIIDHYTFALGGEGCFMEGISSEVFSLAGTLGLSKLIILFDSNDISIEGNISLSFTENLPERMRAFGFSTFEVDDGNNPAKILEAINKAKKDKEKPSFIKIKTKIGFGVPDIEDKAKAHGEPIGEKNLDVLRNNLDWEYAERCFVPDEIYDETKKYIIRLNDIEDKWQKIFSDYKIKYSNDARLLEKYINREISDQIFDDNFFCFQKKVEASRAISSRVLNEIKDEIPFLIGGSADLGPSNKSVMNDVGYFSKEDRTGRNIHFGVRELGMTAIANGIYLHGGLIPYIATFFVFSDYMKPMLRLSSLMGLPIIAILTHDSIGVGEDGPTHEPIEQLSMLRAMPNINVFRPADELETRVAWKEALLSKNTPSALVLSRQNLEPLKNSSLEAAKGGYIISESKDKKLDAIIIATGSEVYMAIQAKEKLEKDGKNIRVISMPCLDIFEKQTEKYKEKILPRGVKKVVVEAGSALSWGKIIGEHGGYITLEHFGASAPAGELFELFGFTVENIYEKVKDIIAKKYEV
ncbi:MAG: transketolase [Clostridiales Family XIII bacterium]|jgi:transketolase|nr:transketolase [Clostridiales Family XIII bacterium]